jgi:myo-inositol-1(or 4)-monophosphatase
VVAGSGESLSFSLIFPVPPYPSLMIYLTIYFRDVAAGMAILLEAGGLVTTANPPENPDTAPIEDLRLGSRLYLAIRPAGPSETETGRESQERTVREVWRRVRHLSYSRPGA